VLFVLCVLCVLCCCVVLLFSVCVVSPRDFVAFIFVWSEQTPDRNLPIIRSSPIDSGLLHLASKVFSQED
jgi:hypothetical protein